jgi:hypothetical protein
MEDKKNELPFWFYIIIFILIILGLIFSSSDRSSNVGNSGGSLRHPGYSDGEMQERYDRGVPDPYFD